MYIYTLPNKEGFIVGDTLYDIYITYLQGQLNYAYGIDNIKELNNETLSRLLIDKIIDKKTLENIEDEENIKKVLNGLGLYGYKVNKDNFKDINTELEFLTMLNTGKRFKPFKNLDEMINYLNELKDLVIYIREKHNDK